VDRIPFLRPNPAKLSEAIEELRQIEASGTFSNFGPVNTRLERDLERSMFGGTGHCVTVCNATIGLMIAIKQCLARAREPRRFALMPSFTFAATAHAALWAGLTPLLCDIDADSFNPSADAETELLEKYAGDIAIIIACTTFGNTIDLARYERLAAKYGVPVVVDAAASLGTLNDDGTGFASGFRSAVVFSMHATKAFATTEAGVIYCADPEVVRDIRAMTNFGFGEARSAVMPGLNAKLNEITALMAHLKLREIEPVITHRAALAKHYEAQLPELAFQRLIGRRHAFTFASALLPNELAQSRLELLAELSRSGVDLRTYFSPHVAEQPYFRTVCVSGDLTNTEDIGRRIISLPLSDFMTRTDVERVAILLHEAGV
jgi:dTDP-4-amino-4,6-dideoxygalactose transaminase